MHDNELWQLFADNGEPVVGKGYPKHDFDDGKLLCGVSHVWIWRRKDNMVEVLLQRRADNKHTWPGYRDISAAGHIDIGESPIDAATRESMEEIGLDLKVGQLKLAFVYHKKAPVYNELQWVYVYELRGDHDFTLHDGEVSSLEWHSLDEVKESVLQNDKLHIVPHAEVYFAQLFQHL